ncbi:pr-set7 [Drosophila busckii]|uniref:Histone-lysine N-methyltransferase Set8 n=1 Tax=Drosophila busckii TaxID=30019 RepID=A0A0M3QXW6_DROBS|nr:histone-lysine N-methyltransferase PR-Set7 [Drosophila busckii]ALC46589.1 pr-set7 [Drosophila busckii]
MIMVRRRARTAKEPAIVVVTSNEEDAAANAAAVNVNVASLSLPYNGAALSAAAAAANKQHQQQQLMDDQYFASPKRKDCRLMKANENLKANINNHSNNTNSNKNKVNAKSEAERNIGVQLATRSQTRTIENFFKAKSANVAKLTEQKTITISELEQQQQQQQQEEEQEEETLLLYEVHSVASPSDSNTTSNSSPAYQLDEEQSNDGSYEASNQHMQHTVAAFQTHRSALRDSHGSSHSSSSGATNNSDNIFLQEPVLMLDIDRTPTKASSIRINKSFELASAVFSSPPAVLSACVLNGRFNQIVSLNGNAVEQEPQQQPPLVPEPVKALSVELDHQDSSSCDSGVACSSSPAAGLNVSMRRRKPATPHRILCPSPIKTMPRDMGLLKNEPHSPRKSPRKLQLQLQQLQQSAACKSRRRLNQPKQQQAPAVHMVPNEETVVVLLDDDEEDMRALERENLNEAAKPMLKPVAVPVPVAAVKPKTSTKSGKIKAPTCKSQPLAATNGNRELTEFFPVRRSVRKTKTAVKEEMMRDLEQAVLEERCEGLQVRHFLGKGRGVVAERRFKRNEFVVEYVGDLISISEASDRERRYALDENAGCYMYYFKHKNQQYCIDATIDTGKLGRLINHSRNGNLMTKVVTIKQRPHLVLLAKDDIEEGEELTYDYGDRSKESLKHHPWLAF